MTDQATWTTLSASTLTPRILKVRVQFNNGDYAKTMECVPDGINNMNELLAALNTNRFIRMTMEDDMAPSLMNTHYIVAVEEVGARIDGD